MYQSVTRWVVGTALLAVPALAAPVPTATHPASADSAAADGLAGSDPSALARVAEGDAGEGLAHLPTKHLTPCDGGSAGGFECSNVDLWEQITISAMSSTATAANDIWGWTDSVSGREFALVGLTNGTSFVEISSPDHPEVIGFLPTQTGNSTWRDIKTFGDYAFVVSEASGHGMQVFDLTELLTATPPATFSNAAFYGEFGNAHNIVIDEGTGFAFAVGTNTCSGGLHMVDINNPLLPTEAGCFSSDGYTHDAQCVIYQGPDTDHQGSEICLAFNEDTVTVVDVTDKNAPVMLDRAPYAGSAYTHQGWLTEDHAFLLVDDEIDESNFGHNTKTYIWDSSDLDDLQLIATYTAATTAVDHNQYVLGNHVFQANYRAGLRILNLDDIANGNLNEVAFFDTEPGGGSGAWSVYPYYPSGNLVVSDIDRGLFLLRPLLCSQPATPLGVSVAAAGDQQIQVDWTSLGGTETYTVYRTLGTYPASGYEVIASGLGGNSFVDSVSGQVDYAYRVASVDETGLCTSVPSGCQSAQTTGACTAPPSFGGLAFGATPNTSDCAIDLAWAAAIPSCGAGVTYSVYRSSDPDFTPSPANRVASGLTATAWSDLEVVYEESYTYIVRAEDQASGTEDANEVRRTLTPFGPITDGTFATGAELGDPTLAGTTGTRHVGWEPSTDRSFEGDRSFFSTYGDDACLVLTSPALELTAGQSSTLSFETLYDIEDRWDGGVLEISVGGAPFTLLTPDQGYPNTFRDSTDACGYSTGDPSFTATSVGFPNSWESYTADLSAFAGQSIELRWVLSTDGAAQEEGWYLDAIAVDHVQVPGACVTNTVLFRDDFETEDTKGWSVTVP